MLQAKYGDTVRVQYTGTLDNGKVFDATSWRGNQPLTLTLGEGKVLPGFEQAALLKKQAAGNGSLIAFELKGGIPAARRFLDNLSVAVLAVSLGGVETLIQHPASMTHAGMSREDRLAAGITDGLVRLAVGCEDIGDLLADFKTGLDGLR